MCNRNIMPLRKKPRKNPKCGSKYVNPDKRVYVKIKDENNTFKWKLQSRVIIEKVTGTKLEHHERVMHRDNNPANNSLTNLVVRDTKKKLKWHADENGNRIIQTIFQWSSKYPACVNPDCHSPNAKHLAHGLCVNCYNRLSGWGFTHPAKNPRHLKTRATSPAPELL